jgi:hypothetical protein
MRTEIKIDGILEVADAAKQLGVPVTFLRQNVRNGRIPSILLSKKRNVVTLGACAKAIKAMAELDGPRNPSDEPAEPTLF